MSTKKKTARKPAPRRASAITLPAVGAVLRNVVKRLQEVQAHAVTCCHALKEQAAEADTDIAEVLRLSVGFPLYRQMVRLSRLAAACDGCPVDEEFADADEPEDNTEGAP